MKARRGLGWLTGLLHACAGGLWLFAVTPVVMGVLACAPPEPAAGVDDSTDTTEPVDADRSAKPLTLVRGLAAIEEDLLYYDPEANALVGQRPADAVRTLPYHDAGEWMEPERFAEFRVVVVATLGGDERRPWEEQEVEALVEWVEQGGTLIFGGGSIFSLSGRQRNVSMLEPLIGGNRYANVPSNRDADTQARVLEPDHPLTRHLPEREPWYEQSIGHGDLTTATPLVGAADVPVVTINEVGDGRVVYVRPQLGRVRDADGRATLGELYRRAIALGEIEAVPADELEDASETEPQVAVFGHGRGRLTAGWLIDHVFTQWATGYPAATLRLSRGTYPPEDRYVEAILWLDEMAGEMVPYHPEQTERIEPQRDAPAKGGVTLSVRDEAGKAVSRERIEHVPGHQLFFSYRLPEGAPGETYRLHARWDDEAGEPIGEASQGFTLGEPTAAEESGRVTLRIENTASATVDGMPMTLGVPFPRGVIHDEANVRLVDERGEEVPLQSELMATWSRFGSIRWLLCDFTADLDGGPRELWLEYGPDVQRTAHEPVELRQKDGRFPELALERLRVTANGIEWDADGTGDFELVIDAAGLTGAFVEREDGTLYTLANDDADREGETVYEIEAHGSEKVVVRRTGWYHDDAGEPFCKYDVRWTFHRDSPLVRILHTWIYTGDANRPADRIANMGWRFDTARSGGPGRFLVGFEDEGAWRQGDYLLQHAHDAFELAADDEYAEGDRAAGVVATDVAGGRAYLGVKDFWQNYPSELAFEEGALVFYQWPLHGRPRTEEPATAEDAWRLHFAHSGEVMDLSIPEEYLDPDGEIYPAASERGHHFRPNQPESVNAQGISKTTEMWLLLEPENADADADTEGDGRAGRTLEGLDRELLRAVVDPHWLRATGAMYELHPHDPANYPEEESLYALHADKPMRHVEYMDVYGMWMWGDLVRHNLQDRTVSLYRAFRKAHWGWPYSWVPFARSGNPEYFKFAEAATRYMTDISFSHYYDDELASFFDEHVDGGYFRGIGWWNRNLIPWTGFRGPTTRMYTDGGEYLWHAYFLTGYERAREIAQKWGEKSKLDDPRYGRARRDVPSARGRSNLLQQYTEMYANTWDPWFMTAAYAIADYQRIDRMDASDYNERNWRTGNREFHRWLGGAGSDYEALFQHHLDHLANPRTRRWANSLNQISPVAYGYHLTGDEHYLRRVEGEIDYARWVTFDDAPEPFRGLRMNTRAHNDLLYTGWLISRFPYALAAVDAADERAEPLPIAYWQAFQSPDPASQPDEEVGYLYPRIHVQKESGESLSIFLEGKRGAEDDGVAVYGPDGERLVNDTTIGAQDELALDASLSGGEYAFKIAGPLSRRHTNLWSYYASVFVPVTPPGTPEVMVLPEGGPMPRGHWFSTYHFKVPQDVESFWMEFKVQEPFREDGRRIAIWAPDGELAWDWQRLSSDYDGEDSVRAEVAVPEAHRSALWRVTLPGNQLGFRFDPQIPPVFSHSADRWFMPEQLR